MPVEGFYTRWDLSDVRCLLPRGRDAVGGSICARDTLCMALEFAKLSYDLTVEPFLNAGWEDVSFQVDDLLLTGLHGSDPKARKNCEQAAGKARARLDKLDPISQFRGFRRQREALDTCKAVVMAHPQEAGPTMIVLAFTGTTKRLYEWLGNLRMEEEGGFHAGFLELTKQFEENAARILFPCTAQRLGFTKLSLADILQHMRMGSDAFRLFITGHSQGAALMQIYIYRLLLSGVPKNQVRGVGFASPCVVIERSLHLAADYPMHHIINADDVVARIGGRMHIGSCCVMPVTQAYRNACYGPRADTRAMRDVLDTIHLLRNTEDALLFGVGMMDALSALPENISEEILQVVARGFLPDVLSQRLAGYARRIAKSLSRRLSAKCVKIIGRRDEEKLRFMRLQVERLFMRYGAKETMALMAEVMLRPHALADRDNPRAYQLLATEYTQALSHSLWVENGMPVWDLRFEGGRTGRRRRRAYDRFHPLSAQRERSHGG